jgi:SPP1 family predicted phage head-tail adaptor
MLTSGKLTERVTIMQPVKVRGEYGEDVVTYEKEAEVWANVVFNRGAEAITAGEMYLGKMVTITMRNNKTITERCRLMWDGKEYRIESMNRKKIEGSVTIVAEYVDNGL